MGFDNECILNIETLAGEYFCPVCRTLVYPREAIQTQCTHLYCKPCLTYVVGSTQACPYDGYLVTEAASKPLMESNKALAEAIGKTSVHCLYHRSGCVWQGPLSECTAHCAGCGFGNSPVVCNRCGVQIVHRQVQEHAQTCNNVNGTNSEALGGSETAAASVDQSKIGNQAVASNPQASHTVAPSTVPQATLAPQRSNPVQQAAPAPAPAPITTDQQWYQQQQQQYYQQYPPYQQQQQQQQQQPYQQYYPPYQQQPQVVQSQPQMQQQIQAPIQPLPQFQMQPQGQVQVPGPVPPPYPPQAAVVGVNQQQSYSQPQMQQYPPQQMMQQYSQPQPHYPPVINPPPPLQPNNVYHPPVPPQPQPQPHHHQHHPPLPPQPQPQPQPPPHMRPPPHMFPPQPPMQQQQHIPPHQQRPSVQQPMPPQQQQPPAFPSFPQQQQQVRAPPPPLGFVQPPPSLPPQSYMGRPPPPPISQQFPTAIPPPHTRPPQFAPTQPSVTQPPPHAVQQQRYVSPLKGDEAVNREDDKSPSTVVNKSESVVVANNTLNQVKPENNEHKTTTGEENEKKDVVVSDSATTTQRVKEENKDGDSPHQTTENQQQEEVNNNNTSVAVTTTEQGTSPYGHHSEFPGPNSNSDRVRGGYGPQSAAAAGQYNHSSRGMGHEGPRHPMDMYPNQRPPSRGPYGRDEIFPTSSSDTSFPSTRPPLGGGGYGYGPPRFHDGHGYHSHSHFGDDHRGRRFDEFPPPMHHDGFGRHRSPTRPFGERHSFGGHMMHHHNNNRGGEFDGGPPRHMGFGESYGPFRGRGEAFGGRPRLGEPGFRSSYSPQPGFFTGGDSFDFDGGLSQRKRKTTSVGWCRICKIDCESVEGLEMHGQTRDHQRMAMDMVLTIKRNNTNAAKKLKPSNNHHSTRDDPRNAPELRDHTIT